MPHSRGIVYLCAALLMLASSGCGGGEVDTSSETYRDAVAAFYAGLAAVQVGEDQRADAKLLQVTELAPEEPAAWANLGLLALRRNAFDVATERLSRARDLAPENSRIRLIIGLGESIQGDYEHAIINLRQAIALDSSNVKAWYALAQALARSGADAGEDTDVLDEVLRQRPNNLAVWIERLRAAARAGDASTVSQAMTRIRALSGGWPPEALEQLSTLENAAKEDPKRAATPVVVLRNVLLRERQYRSDLAEVQTPPEQVGDMITRLLVLPMPRVIVAPADDSLHFDAQPVDASGPWQALRPILLNPNAEAVLVRADREGVRLPDVDTTLSVSGGTRSADGLLGLDADNDFWMDLAVAGPGGFRLFRQDSAATFHDVTPQTGLPSALTRAAYTGVWAADLDLEGDLDLILGADGGDPVVLRNHGDASFERMPVFTGIDGLEGFAWADLDGDGDPDAALLDAHGTIHVFANERGGHFAAYAAPPDTDHTLALDVSDLDGDARIDFVALAADGNLRRFSIEPGGAWSATSLGAWEGLPAGLHPGDVHLFTVDFDNNGAIDVLAASTTRARLWLGDDHGAYRPPLALDGVHVTGFTERTGDGRIDLVGLSPEGHPVVLVNRGVKPYHWRQIRPQATAATGDRRINTFGLGGEIEIRAGLLFQKQPIKSPVVYFGLGDHLVADVARIVWPNGDVQAEFDLLSDEVLSAQQRLKGSCPWLFTYDGRKMRFVTDFLWRSPLGLKINAQKTAGVMTTEDRVKIGGDELKPRNGYYDLRITAELWETHYFDHVSLMTVDHPPGTEVYLDERFAFPPPPLDIKTTMPPQPVAQVWDDRGQDVTDFVRTRDARYLDDFGRGEYQGITRDHFIEIDLGDAPVERPLWLLATGWIRPTDSSINVAISQGRHPAPKGLRMEVPDGSGGWRVVAPNLGFPSGKAKTILIDLEGVFAPGAPHRVRLYTNLEIYWDALAWAEKRPGVAIQTHRLQPETADLRYRGFSRVNTADGSSPELPDYQDLKGTIPVWRDLIGYYTRFGDVRELLAGVDDRYVIMNAGDEMVFRFPVPPPPPVGWTRDFVLIGDGWVKDGDYNTAFSKTVLPLPSHDNSTYTTPPGRLEDDPVYRRHAGDWQTYHTRYVTPEQYAQALRATWRTRH